MNQTATKPPPYAAALIDSTSVRFDTLASLRTDRTPVRMFLINGVKLEGIIIDGFDDACIWLTRAGQGQLVFVHAISTIMPAVSAA